MSEKICPMANVEEVFATAHGAVYQCSRQNCYWLDFNGMTTSFAVVDFFRFKKSIDRIDVARMINDVAHTPDCEIIMPFRTDRCFVLFLDDIMHLRELLAGAKFMIELNSTVRSCLHVCPFA